MLIEATDFVDLAVNPLTSVTLQNLCSALARGGDLNATLFSSLIGVVWSKESLPNLLKSNDASSSSPSSWQRIFFESIKPRFDELVGDRPGPAHYLLKTCLQSVPTPELASGLSAEVQQRLSNILSTQSYNVACAFLDMIVKFPQLAPAAQSALFTAIGADSKGSQAVTSLLSEQHRQGRSHFGCQMLATILDFPENQSQSSVSGLCKLDVDALAGLAMSPHGSRLMEKLLKKTSPKQSKGISVKLTGKFAELALDPNGSRVVESVFEAGSFGARVSVAQGLVPQYTEINDTLHGMMCCRK
eukprot:gene4088-4424_t